MQTVIQKNPFKAHHISQLLFKFSAPALIGMLVNALNNIISRIFIGNSEGVLGIAGITIIFPLAFVFMAVSVLIGVGANAIFSIRLGEHKHEEAEIILGNAFSSLTLLSIVTVTASYVFMDPILKLCGATPEILPYAKEYCFYILPGYFIFIISAGLNNFIRSSGKPKTAMATQIIIAVTNIICAPIFIYVFNWGMKGAALAIVVGDVISTVWIMAFFLGKRAPYRLKLKNLAIKWNIFKESIYIGFAQFVFQLSAGILNVILNHALVRYGGNVAVSAMGIVVSVNTIFTMPVIGISQGAQPLIGYNHGARKYKTSIQTLKMAIRWGVLITTIGFITVQLFARPIVSIFNANDTELIDMAAYALRIFNLVLPIVALPILTSSFFQAINRPGKAALVSLSRQILMLIPLVIILPLFWGLNGVFFAPPIADLLSTILAIFLLRRHFNKHKQNFFFSNKYK